MSASRRALSLSLAAAIVVLALPAVTQDGPYSTATVSKAGGNAEGDSNEGPRGLAPRALRGGKQWTLPSEKSKIFPGGKLTLAQSVVKAQPDAGKLLISSGAAGDDGSEQSAELLMQLMSLFQKKHGRMPTEGEVRQWGDVFRSTVVDSQLARANGEVAQKVVHISGMYIDLGKALVLVKRQRRHSVFSTVRDQSRCPPPPWVLGGPAASPTPPPAAPRTEASTPAHPTSTVFSCATWLVDASSCPTPPASPTHFVNRCGFWSRWRSNR